MGRYDIRLRAIFSSLAISDFHSFVLLLIEEDTKMFRTSHDDEEGTLRMMSTFYNYFNQVVSNRMFQVQMQMKILSKTRHLLN